MEIESLKRKDDVAHLPDGDAMRDEAAIRGWLVSAIAKALRVGAGEIDPTVPFDRYGLDSVAAVELTGDLETWLRRSLPPTLMYDYPTIDSLSVHLARQEALAA